MVSAKPMWFSDLRTEVFRLHHQNDYQGALALIDREGARQTEPAQAATVIYWRACFLSLLNQPDEAVAALQDGLSKGFWWGNHSLLYDPDLAILQKREDFQEITAECNRRNKEADAALPVPAAHLIAEPLLETPRPYPALLALHGYGGNAPETLTHWESLAKRGWLVAAVQSTQRAGMNGYHWMNEERSRSDVQSVLEQIASAHPIDRSRLVIAGFSNGAWLSLTFALTGVFPVKHVISVGGTLSNEDAAALDWDTLRAQEVRILLITGEQDDRVVPRMTQQAALFREHDLEVDLQIIPGLGHDYPPDFHERLAKALAWLT